MADGWLLRYKWESHKDGLWDTHASYAEYKNGGRK